MAMTRDDWARFYATPGALDADSHIWTRVREAQTNHIAAMAADDEDSENSTNPRQGERNESRH